MRARATSRTPFRRACGRSPGGACAGPRRDGVARHRRGVHPADGPAPAPASSPRTGRARSASTTRRRRSSARRGARVARAPEAPATRAGSRHAGRERSVDVVDPIGESSPAQVQRAGRRRRRRRVGDSTFVDPLARRHEGDRGGRRRHGRARRRASVDPLADVMKDIEARQGRGAAAPPEARRATLPFGADKWGRDVITKTIKGSETSIFVGLAAALVATLHRHGPRRASPATTAAGSTTLLNWFYSVFSSIPYLLLILAVAAVLQHKGTHDHRADPGPHRLDRRVPPDPRRIPEAQGRASTCRRPTPSAPRTRAACSRTSSPTSRTWCWCSCRSSSWPSSSPR